jgi:hypothetical protein
MCEKETEDLVPEVYYLGGWRDQCNRLRPMNICRDCFKYCAEKYGDKDKDKIKEYMESDDYVFMQQLLQHTG